MLYIWTLYFFSNVSKVKLTDRIIPVFLLWSRDDLCYVFLLKDYLYFSF